LRDARGVSGERARLIKETGAPTGVLVAFDKTLSFSTEEALSARLDAYRASAAS
jgi:hypothetical protein